MDTQIAKELVAKHGSLELAAKAAGVGKSSVWRALHRGAPKAPQAMGIPQKGRSLAEFRQSFDKSFIVPKKIDEALKALGNDGWDYEVGFAKLAGLTLADLGNHRDKYADFVVTIRERRAWAGSKGLAAKMRSML